MNKQTLFLFSVLKTVQVKGKLFRLLMGRNVPCLVSCRDDFNIQVLHAFVELHEFTDLNLVQALR